MSTYYKKYFGYFGDMSGVQHTVELWIKDVVIVTPLEMRLGTDPFSIEMPKLDGKFQPVRGTGCSINILSETDMQYFTDFVFVDPLQWMVKHYIGATLNWVGWLNAEIYREPYDMTTNYMINLTGNDGFALMERFTYVNTDGTYLTGIDSLWEVLSFIIGSTELPFTHIRVALSTTFTGYTAGADVTILHETHIDNANFYDEDNYPLTMRRVLEGLLLPFGAFITQVGGILYITDIHTLATGGSISFKRFEPDGVLGTFQWNYLSTAAVTLTKSVATVGYRGTGQEIEEGGGVNKQVVVYSPYPTKNITAAARDNYIPISGYDEFTTVPGAWSDKDGYHYKTLVGNRYWNVFTPAGFEVAMMRYEPTYTYATVVAMEADAGPNAHLEDITYIVTADTVYRYHWSTADARYIPFPKDRIFGTPEMFHIRVPYCAINQKVAEMKENPYVMMSASTTVGTGTDINGIKGTGLFIKGRFAVIAYLHRDKTYHFPHNMVITMKIKVGTFYYSGYGGNGTWTTTDSFCWFRIREGWQADYYTLERAYGDGVIKLSDIYNEPKTINLGDSGALGLWLPADRDLSGELSIEIWSNMAATFDFTNLFNYASIRWFNASMDFIKEFWISHIQVDIESVDGTAPGDVDNGDVEYVGTLDQTYKDEGKSVTLICGTEKKTTDRAKLMSYIATVYANIYAFIRQGQTKRVEELLLNSYCSNYKSGYTRLNSMKMNNTINQLNILTDTFISGRMMMVSSLETNYWDSVVYATFEEILPDQLTIVPL